MSGLRLLDLNRKLAAVDVVERVKEGVVCRREADAAAAQLVMQPGAVEFGVSQRRRTETDARSTSDPVALGFLRTSRHRNQTAKYELCDGSAMPVTTEDDA